MLVLYHFGQCQKQLAIGPFQNTCHKVKRLGLALSILQDHLVPPTITGTVIEKMETL
jgi:hypothetical protein